MDRPRHSDATAAEWAAILADSEAEAETGLFVSGDAIIRELHASIARMAGGGVPEGRTGPEAG